MSVENLIQNVDSQIINIRTKSLDISFNELYDMYKNNELEISPDYQRLFRWGEEKQSRFIESLILEMPVPPIFVIETDDGIYELIDGLQRISSYLHFRGERLGETEDDFLVLNGCDIVNDLNGLIFDNLPKALQIKIKRSFVRMEVIRKDSEPSLKYHMFKRLNTGGELLSAQEIRNCTIRLLGPDGINFIKSCSKNKDFISVINKIPEEKIKTKYDQELVLRFFALKNDIANYKYPVTEYLTKYLEKITTGELPFDYEKEKDIFEKTFNFINNNWGKDVFSIKNSNGTMQNKFVSYVFDGISVSTANLVYKILESSHQKKLIEEINNFKESEELKSYKTGSINGIKTRIKLFTERMEKILDSK